MWISPNQNRDYNEIIENGIKESEVQLSLDDIDEYIKYNCNYDIINTGKNNRVIRIFDCNIALLVRQYNQIKNGNTDDKMLNFHKVLIYDLIDLRNATGIFIGIQLQNVARSIIEHTRMYLLCLFNEKFKKSYFELYKTEQEKWDRFREKQRPKKVSDQLTNIYERAMKETKKNGFECEKLIKLINSKDLYERLYDNFSELAHLNEFNIASGVLDNSSRDLCFNSSTTWMYSKYYDYIIEYVIATVIIIFLKNDEILQCDYKDKTINICNLLIYVYNKLYTFRATDKVLKDLKNKCKKIWEDGKYKIGDIVQCKINKIKKDFIYVDILISNVKGSIHISNISLDHKYIHDINNIVKVGDIINAKVIRIDNKYGPQLKRIK